MHVVGEGSGLGIREATAVRAVVGDRTAIGLVSTDRELDHAHPERVRSRSDGAAGDAVDPRRAEVGDFTVRAIGLYAAANAVARLEDDDGAAGRHE